jgi:biopolymer transport protein ExbD
MQVASPIPKKHARIEIIPLIDIMFFLLASFMMVSLSQTHMKGIKVALPSATVPPPNTPKDFVSIRVGAGNTVSFDGQYVTDDQVMPRLFQLHAANPNIKVSISAEGMALHGDVIRVLDEVRRAVFRKSVTKFGLRVVVRPDRVLPVRRAPRLRRINFPTRRVLCVTS